MATGFEFKAFEDLYEGETSDGKILRCNKDDFASIAEECELAEIALTPDTAIAQGWTGFYIFNPKWGGQREGAGRPKAEDKGQEWQQGYQAGYKSGIRKNEKLFTTDYVERVQDLQDRSRQFCASTAEGATEEETKALRLAETRQKAEDLVWHIQLETGYKLEDLQRLFAPTTKHYPELSEYQPDEVMLREVTRYCETIQGFPPTTLTDQAKLRSDLDAFWQKFSQ